MSKASFNEKITMKRISQRENSYTGHIPEALKSPKNYPKPVNREGILGYRGHLQYNEENIGTTFGNRTKPISLPDKESNSTGVLKNPELSARSGYGHFCEYNGDAYDTEITETRSESIASSYGHFYEEDFDTINKDSISEFNPAFKVNEKIYEKYEKTKKAIGESEVNKSIEILADKLSQRSTKRGDLHQRIKIAFAPFERKINIEQFRRALESLSCIMSDHQTVAIFSRFDNSCSGYIDWTEFATNLPI